MHNSKLARETKGALIGAPLVQQVRTEGEPEPEETQAPDISKDFDRMLLTRRIFLYQDIEEEVAANITERILILTDDNPKADIELYINSWGGNPYAAMALYDLFNSVKPDIKTIVLGYAASAAAFVAASGTRGKRHAGRNATFMYHQLWWEERSAVKVREMTIRAAEGQRFNDLMDRIFSKLTGKPLKEIRRDAENECWLDARAALKYGIIDKLL